MSELEQKATEAWALLVAEKMPVLVALDYVQDVTGDRDDAVTEIHRAAGAWLDSRRPDVLNSWLCKRIDAGDFPSASLNAAVACRAHLMSESYSLAESCRLEVEMMHRETQFDLEPHVADDDDPLTDEGYDALNLAGLWLSWCHSARLAIETCRQVTASAYPGAVAGEATGRQEQQP